MTRAFAPTIAANGGGSILNILSVLSWTIGAGDRRLQRRQVGRLEPDQRAPRCSWPATGIRVAGLHVGYMDTDMARQVTSPKIAPEYVAKVGDRRRLPMTSYEIVVDDLSRGVQSGLAGGVPALYPQLP